MERPPIEAVLFDNDGTLVDSEAISNEVMVATLGRHGIELGLEEAVTRWSGVDLHLMLRVLQEESGVTLPEDFLDEFRAGQLAELEARVEAMPGAAEVLRRLELPRAVVSNAPVTKIALCLRAAGLMEFIDERHLYSAYDVGKWKPDPASYLHAAGSMGVAPERCAVVEDSVSGVEAGRAAGMRTFAFDHRGELPDWPDVERLEALTDLLDRLG